MKRTIPRRTQMKAIIMAMAMIFTVGTAGAREVEKVVELKKSDDPKLSRNVSMVPDSCPLGLNSSGSELTANTSKPELVKKDGAEKNMKVD